MAEEASVVYGGVGLLQVEEILSKNVKPYSAKKERIAEHELWYNIWKFSMVILYLIRPYRFHNM